MYNFIKYFFKALYQNLKQIYVNGSLSDKYGCSIHRTVKINYDSLDHFELSKGVSIGAYSIIVLENYPGENNSHLQIGEDTYIGELNNLRPGGGSIKIGKKCLISQGVSLIVTNHYYKKDKYIKDQEWSKEKNFIIIEDDVWIGCNSVILPGVKLGKGSIIAAGSVVAKSVERYSIVAGNPAKVIKERS